VSAGTDAPTVYSQQLRKTGGTNGLNRRAIGVGEKASGGARSVNQEGKVLR
jgi:hypothetical protein